MRQGASSSHSPWRTTTRNQIEVGTSAPRSSLNSSRACQHGVETIAFPQAEAVGQRARGHLRFIEIGGNVGIAHRDELEQCRLIDESIEKDDMIHDARSSCPRDERLAIRLALLEDQVRMRRSEHDVDCIAGALEDLGYLPPPSASGMPRRTSSQPAGDTTWSWKMAP